MSLSKILELPGQNVSHQLEAQTPGQVAQRSLLQEFKRQRYGSLVHCDEIAVVQGMLTGYHQKAEQFGASPDLVHPTLDVGYSLQPWAGLLQPIPDSLDLQAVLKAFHRFYGYAFSAPVNGCLPYHHYHRIVQRVIPSGR